MFGTGFESPHRIFLKRRVNEAGCYDVTVMLFGTRAYETDDVDHHTKQTHVHFIYTTNSIIPKTTTGNGITLQQATNGRVFKPSLQEYESRLKNRGIFELPCFYNGAISIRIWAQGLHKAGSRLIERRFCTNKEETIVECSPK